MNSFAITLFARLISPTHCRRFADSDIFADDCWPPYAAASFAIAGYGFSADI